MGFLRFPYTGCLWGSAWRPFGPPELRYKLVRARLLLVINYKYHIRALCPFLDFLAGIFRGSQKEARGSRLGLAGSQNSLPLQETKPITEYRATFNHAPNEPARLARLLLHAYQLFLVLLSTAEPNEPLNI